MRARVRSTVSLVAFWLGTVLACGGGRSPAAKSPGAGDDAAEQQDLEEPEARRPRERSLDRRISVDNVEERLTKFIESIGAGLGPGARPSGFVSLSAGGDRIYEHAFGHADIGAETENTDDTSFRIGAISAQFTATAVLRLVQAKKLSLDDRIRQLLPDYPPVGANISVRQLLTHTSGLPNYLTRPELLERRAEKLTPRELLAFFWSEPLDFAPGSDFGYSDSDYVVLGAIIERVTKQSYAEYMRREIFERFDLDDTTVGAPESAEDAARGYQASNTGSLEPAAGFDDSILYAAAGIRSTAHDLLAWHDALAKGEVLSLELEKTSLRVAKNNYAAGWFVREQRGHTVVSHPGGLAGFSSHFTRVPDLDLSIVVLMNNSSVDATTIADAALGIALGEKIEPLPRATSVPLDASVPPRITGTYRLSEETAKRLEQSKIPKRALYAMRSVRIYEEGGKLYFKPQGQAAVPMVATGRSSFVLVGGKAKIEVPLDPGGAPATRVMLEQGPLHAEFTRRARQRGKPEEAETTEDGEKDAEEQ